MAAGKPIIALTEENSELARVIDEEDIGWYVEPGDAMTLRTAIIAAYDSPDRLTVMGRLAREAALAKYSTEAAVDAYRGALARGELRAGASPPS